MSFACINPRIIYPANHNINQQENKNSYFIEKTKPNFTPRKDKRKGSENRQKTGDRERNVAYPNGEEHSRVPKGNGYKRLTSIAVLTVTTAVIVALAADDCMVIGIADDPLIAPAAVIWWEALCGIAG